MSPPRWATVLSGRTTRAAATYAASLGAPCQARVVSDLTKGVYSVRQVTLRFEETADLSVRSQVIQLAAGSCGIGVECVVEEWEADRC